MYFGSPIEPEVPESAFINETELLDEYVITNGIDFDMPDFSKGVAVGTISTKAGPMIVWMMETAVAIGFAAVDPKIGPENPLGYLGFAKMSGNNKLVMARTALTREGFEGKGIQSELFLFVNKVRNLSILSDTTLSPSGEKLWNALVASGKFSHHIVDVATGETFSEKDVGQKTTSDNIPVISPKDDNLSNQYYDGHTNTGQRFFLLTRVHK